MSTPLAHSLCPPHPWLLVRVWITAQGQVRLRAGGHGPTGEWRFSRDGQALAPLLEELAREQNPSRARTLLSLDQSALLEPLAGGAPCHNLVSGGRRRLVPGGKTEPVRAGAVVQATLGVNRLLAPARWEKLQAEKPAEQERRLARDLDAFSDLADYLWEHGHLRIGHKETVVSLPCGWLPPDHGPLAGAFDRAIADGRPVLVQLKPRRIDPDLRYHERALPTGRSGEIVHSDLGDYPLEAVYGLDREGPC